ncbi:CDP-archaeol synthase [Candidatus Woesearchaeota archaeon]|jgi:CDP-2,3-bis-(O-geranylgeranyl)-sn-glycerol synthase|nr:CDP-archaeol synthase [Candidatus Woesearchaeota archaeon]MBT5342488.1 CDP-archaeol synthase [Candidatus Woesearchaeota archaeon]
MIWLLILKSLYFFLPAYIANMAPILLKWIPFLEKPVHKKKFGDHKTWRGLIVASLTGILVFWLQIYLFQFSFFQNMSLIDYSGFTVLLGFLLGFGAIIGDLIKSYYKRKNKIAPGKSWIPYDQVDFVIGGIIFSFFIYVPTVSVVVILLLISPLLHILTNIMGYLLKINKNWL